MAVHAALFMVIVLGARASLAQSDGLIVGGDAAARSGALSADTISAWAVPVNPAVMTGASQLRCGFAATPAWSTGEPTRVAVTATLPVGPIVVGGTIASSTVHGFSQSMIAAHVA